MSSKMASVFKYLGLLLLVSVIGVTSLIHLKDGTLECDSEGRFSHPDNCWEYIECVPNQRSPEVGHYSLRHGSCRGGVFNPEVKKCLSPRQEKNCTNMGRKPRALQADSSYNIECIDRANGFYCISCKTLVHCYEGRAFVDTCVGSYLCDMREDYGGGVCYPNSPEECTCNGENELKTDFYDDRKFIECKPGEDPISHICSNDMIFSEEEKLCVHKDGHYECSSEGHFVDPSDCSMYHGCTISDNGWVHVPYDCPCGTLFNEASGECEKPCTWPTGTFVCEVEGRFPDLSDCTKFYECVTDLQIHQQCPEGYHWRPDSVVEGVGLCVPVAEYPECKPVIPPTCDIPLGWCQLDEAGVMIEDQCTEDVVGCECSAEAGIFSCAVGFNFDGITCVDIDECTDDPCDVNAVCNNIDGAFECICSDGYEGNGFTCAESAGDDGGDECGLMGVCQTAASCVDQDGAMTCVCNDGYIGDGTTYCDDIDECVGEHPCGELTCNNILGSYECVCDEGQVFVEDECVDECDVERDDVCYWVGRHAKKNWDMAKTFCETEGGKLAGHDDMDSWELMNDFKNILSNSEILDGLWLGGIKNEAGDWVWFDTDDVVEYSPLLGENGDCLSMMDNIPPYTSTDCQTPKRYICQKPIESDRSLNAINRRFYGDRVVPYIRTFKPSA